MSKTKSSSADQLHCWRSETIDVFHALSLTHSAADNPVQSLMSSIQRLLGLPRPLTSPTRPWSIDVARFCSLTMCPRYFSFCLRTSIIKSRFGSTCARIDMLVLCSAQLMRRIFFYMLLSQMLLTSSFCCLQCPRFTTRLPLARPCMQRWLTSWVTHVGLHNPHSAIKFQISNSKTWI